MQIRLQLDTPTPLPSVGTTQPLSCNNNNSRDNLSCCLATDKQTACVGGNYEDYKYYAHTHIHTHTHTHKLLHPQITIERSPIYIVLLTQENTICISSFVSKCIYYSCVNSRADWVAS